MRRKKKSPIAQLEPLTFYSTAHCLVELIARTINQSLISILIINLTVAALTPPITETLFYRNPIPSERPDFTEVSRELSLPDSKLLKWSEEDKRAHPEAAKLGPISCVPRNCTRTCKFNTLPYSTVVIQRCVGVRTAHARA